MNVVNLQIYRNKKELQRLQNRVSQAALSADVGSIREIKTCFINWLKHSS